MTKLYFHPVTEKTVYAYMPKAYPNKFAENGVEKFKPGNSYETEEQFQTANTLVDLLSQELKVDKGMCIAKITILQDFDDEHKTMIFTIERILMFMQMREVMQKTCDITVIRNILALYGLYQALYDCLDKETTGFIIYNKALDPKTKHNESVIVYSRIKDLIEALPAEKPDEYHVYCVTNTYPKICSEYEGLGWISEEFEILQSDIRLELSDSAKYGPAWLRLEHVKTCYNQGKIRYMAVNDPSIEVRIEAIKRLDFAHNTDGMFNIESVVLNILADDVPACQLALLQNQCLSKSEKLRKLILKISAKFGEPAISEVAKTLMEE